MGKTKQEQFVQKQINEQLRRYYETAPNVSTSQIEGDILKENLLQRGKLKFKTGQPIVSIAEMRKSILSKASRLESEGFKYSQDIREELEFHSYRAIKRAFPSWSQATINAEVTQNVSAADNIGQALKNMLRISDEFNQPSIAKGIYKSMSMIGKGPLDLTMIGKGDLKAIIDEPFRIYEDRGNKYLFRKADHWANEIRNTIKDYSDIEFDTKHARRPYRITSIGGAPVMEFSLRTRIKGEFRRAEFQVPITEKVPTGRTGYRIFGKFLESGGARPASLGDFLVNRITSADGYLSRWQSGKTTLPITGREFLKDNLQQFEELFPRQMPIPQSESAARLQGMMAKTLVNVEVSGEKTAATTKRMLNIRGYYPSDKTAQVIRGEGNDVLMTQMRFGFDVSKILPAGEMADLSKGLEKGLRSEAFLTQNAAQKAAEYRAQMGITPLRGRKGLFGAERKTVDMVTVMAPQALLEKAGIRLGEGEFLAKPGMEEMFETQVYRTHKIMAPEGFKRIAPEVAEAARLKAAGLPVAVALPPGRMLGVDIDSDEIVSSLTTKLKQVRGVETRDILDRIVDIKGIDEEGRLKVVVQRVFRGEAGMKLFSDTSIMKHTAQFTETESEFMNMLNKLTGGHSSRVGAIMTADKVYDNPYMRKVQVASSMAYFLRNKPGLDGTMEVSEFLRQPLDYTEAQMAKIAEKARLPATAVGEIFGAFYERAEELGDIAPSTRKAIAESKGVIASIVTGLPGGSEMAAEFGRGTMEYRAHWMPTSGEAGEAITNMLTRRRITSGAAQRVEVERALAVTSGAMDIIPEDLMATTQEITDDFLSAGEIRSAYSQEGTMLKLTDEQFKKYGDVTGRYLYMPAKAEVAAMRPHFAEATGEIVPGSLLKHYMGVMRGIQEGVGVGAVTTSMKELRKELLYQHATTISGTQRLNASIRAQVQSAASREQYQNFLQKQGTFAVGISEEAFESMLSEMEMMDIDKDVISTQRKAFQSTKDTFASSKTAQRVEGALGAVWRHPQIGKWSTIPVEFYHDPLAGAGRPHLTVQDEMREAFGIHEATAVDEHSIIKGMQGDYDADRLGAALLDDKTASKVVRQQIADDSLKQQYVKHLATLRKAEVAVRPIEPLVGEVEDAILQARKKALIGEVGGVTWSMEQVLKGAVASGKKGLMDQAFLLAEIVPQQLISAKHLSIAEVDKLEGIGERMMQAVGARDTKKAAQDLSAEIGIKYDLAKLRKEVGIDVTETIKESLTHRASVAETDIDAYLEWGRKRSKATTAEAISADAVRLSEMMRDAQSTIYRKVLPDPSDTIFSVKNFEKATSGGSGAEAAAANAMTKAKAAFAGIGRSHAMIAGATAVSAGLFYLGMTSREKTGIGGYQAMAPPGPRPGVQPSQMEIPDLNFQSKPRYITPEQLKGGKVHVMPSGPKDIHETPRALVDQDTTPLSNIIRIRAREIADTDYNEMVNRIRSSMRIPSSVNVNINDNSSNITPDTLDRMLERTY